MNSVVLCTVRAPLWRGNDSLVDFNYKARNKNPDYFHCGPGRDEVSNTKGLDRVADACEVLHAAKY